MCHFYANPLSVLVSSEVGQEEVLQAEHMEAIRSTASFRNHVEAVINTETTQEEIKAITAPFSSSRARSRTSFR